VVPGGSWLFDHLPARRPPTLPQPALALAARLPALARSQRSEQGELEHKSIIDERSQFLVMTCT